MAEIATRHKRGGIYFDDFEPGQRFEHPLTRTVTQMDNMLFSNMTLNPQPLHIDRHFCEQETEWGQPLMNSLFTLGLMIGIQVADTTVGTTIANLGMTEVKFPHPLFEGDTVHCTTEVIGKREVEVAQGRRHRRIPSSRLQPGQQAGRRMPAAGVHHHAATLMRSLLFVPADSGRKLDKAMASGADAVIVDLEDSIAAENKSAARKNAVDFLRDAVQLAKRPRLLVRVNGLHTGLTDADLDAIVAARPDSIMLPKAEGGASVAHTDAKLTAREAIAGLPEGHIKIVAIATETAASLFLTGTYGGSSARLEGMTWGAEDLSADLGAEVNRDAVGRFLSPYLMARALCLAGAAVAHVAGDRYRRGRIPQHRRGPPRDRGSAARRLHRQDGDPSGAGAGDQRGVHADDGRGCQGARRGRRLRGASGHRHGRHRRHDVRPPASRTRPPVDRTGERCRGRLT